MEIKTTPLFASHQQLGARIAPFGGWSMPIQYSGILAEHEWTRSGCSVFDICHMGEFLIQGDLSTSNLDYIVTVDVGAMAAHTCRYGFMLNKGGGVIDDIIVYKISGDSCMLVVNAATTEADEVHLRTYLSPTVKFENISAKTGKLDLQGPRSREVLMDIVGPDISRLAYYTFDYFNVCGERNIISRTGYTGELGYELYCSADKVNELWTRLLQDKRVKPAGLGARDTLRLEVGYPLYGQDMDSRISPLEAGFESFVDFNKNFLGKDVLMKQVK
ncbi:MAG: glycine cleavage system aminomethyltransferase GcvT, partial [Candidatus Omnitrophica bacterium]|nr:glycine cleavage system aminomethyltransferase GcvT [Candidatus Omnitrophota bacterium]